MLSDLRLLGVESQGFSWRHTLRPWGFCNFSQVRKMHLLVFAWVSQLLVFAWGLGSQVMSVATSALQHPGLLVPRYASAGLGTCNCPSPVGCASAWDLGSTSVPLTAMHADLCFLALQPRSSRRLPLQDETNPKRVIHHITAPTLGGSSGLRSKKCAQMFPVYSCYRPTHWHLCVHAPTMLTSTLPVRAWGPAADLYGNCHASHGYVLSSNA